jgi:hypothetical protein
VGLRPFDAQGLAGKSDHLELQREIQLEQQRLEIPKNTIDPLKSARTEPNRPQDVAANQWERTEKLAKQTVVADAGTQWKNFTGQKRAGVPARGSVTIDQPRAEAPVRRADSTKDPLVRTPSDAIRRAYQTAARFEETQRRGPPVMSAVTRRAAKDGDATAPAMGRGTQRRSFKV